MLRNYRVFFDAAGLDHSSAVLVNHEHGANVVRVNNANAGQGLVREPLPFCDAMITNDPSLTLVTLHADCGCCYLYDPEHRAIGLAHAGWKGTLKRVAQRMVERMSAEFGSEPSRMHAALGPCICRSCFEVGEEIADEFVKEFSCAALKLPGRKGKAYTDIEAALALQLEDAGLAPENITSMGLCTYEREDLFFSYRRDKGQTGAMIGFLKLENRETAK